MKKRFIAGSLVCVMALTFVMPAMSPVFTIPVMASNVSMVPVDAEIQDPAPFHEVTQIVLRTYNGQLQMRVWGLTSGQWLTDWITITPA